PDRYPNPRPVLDGVGKDFLRLAKIIAGIKQAIDFHAVPRPPFDLVEIAMVRDQRVVGLFVGPIGHELQASSSSRRTAGASGFLILSQCAERPARYGEPSRFDTMPSQPSAQACL